MPVTYKNVILKNSQVLTGTAYESSASIIDGYAASLAKKYAAARSNRDYILDINADTGSTDLTGDTMDGAIRGRTVIGTTQTNASIYGVHGNIDVGASKNLTSGNFAGVYGVLDFYGACTLAGAAPHAAAAFFTVWNEGTTTLNSAGGSVSGIEIIQNTGKPTLTAGINPAIYIRGSASTQWQYGIWMSPTHVLQAMKVGTAYETSGSIIDGYGLSLAASYGAGSSNRLFGVDINVDTGSTDITGDTFDGAIRGRTVIGTTQTNASLYGVVGNVDVGASKNIISNYAGLYGVTDFYGNSTLGGSVTHVAGVIGTIWNEGTTTLNSAGGSLAGFDAVQNGSAPTLTAGINPAFNVRSTNTWQYALSAIGQNALEGIIIGTSSSSAANAPKLSATHTAINRFHAEDGGSAVAAGNFVRNVLSRFLVTGAQNTTASGSALVGQLRVAGGSFSGSGYWSGVNAIIETSGTNSIGAGSGAETRVAAVNASIELGGTPTVGASGIVSNIMCSLNAASGTTINGGIHVLTVQALPVGGAGWTEFLRLEDPASCGFVSDNAAVGAVKKIKCDFGGSAYYINCYLIS